MTVDWRTTAVKQRFSFCKSEGGQEDFVQRLQRDAQTRSRRTDCVQSLRSTACLQNSCHTKTFWAKRETLEHSIWVPASWLATNVCCFVLVTEETWLMLMMMTHDDSMTRLYCRRSASWTKSSSRGDITLRVFQSLMMECIWYKDINNQWNEHLLR
jgi:hypothetical protein